MREIKYRQWTQNRKWHYWGFTDGGFINPLHEPGDTMTDTQKHSQQHTGLKDKNGREIYEGDIILRADGSIATVVYEGTAFETQPRRPMRVSALRLDFDAVEGVEVAGNVYETPELLK
jgi:uncharacterized phage protein (TIGR01671 family)